MGALRALGTTTPCLVMFKMQCHEDKEACEKTGWSE